MATVVQKSAFKPGKYRGKLLSAAKLRAFLEGTNKALSVGVAVPALKKHSPLKADDAQLERHSATEGSGWLEKVEADADGALAWHIKDAPDDIAKGIADGTIKFTSPEFRENYVAPDGRYTGPIIRHIAFTPQPGAPDQGKIEVLALDDAYQFSDEDFEGPEEKSGDEGSKPPELEGKPKEKNPDSPPKTTNETKTAAAREGLEQLGIVLPSDYDFGGMDEPALDILITGLNTACKAKQEAESKNETEGDDGEDDKVEQYPIAFSDEELAALPEKARTAIKAAADLNAKVKQFSDEKASALKDKTIADIKACKHTPPAIKQKLIARLEPLQFSDEGESPTLTIGDAHKLIAESLPEQFGDDDTTSPEHPEGEAFFTGDPGKVNDEQATKLANKVHSRNKTAIAA